MKKYDLYKDSGFEWIGEIPNHWKVIRLKHKGEVIIGLSYNPDNVVDEEYGTLVLRSSNIQNGKISLNDNVYVDSLISEKLRTRKGDILICSRNGSRNLIGKNCLITPEVEGKTWGVFMSLYRSKNPYFLYWILNSPIFESQSGLYLTSTINQLTVSTLENLVVPFTEDELEQHQIVKYLDEKTTIIDTLIDKTQQKIDTLKELRTSLINKVVTKGLDPNVEMKDSGVEWIGEIPKHWVIVPLKYVFTSGKDSIKTGPFGSQLQSSDYVSEGIKVYNQRTVYDENFIQNELYVDYDKFQQLSGFEVFSEDILITSRGTIGRCTIVPDEIERGILHPCLIRIRINDNLLNKNYLKRYINDSSIFIETVKLESNSTTIDVIYSDTLKNLQFPLPPLSEQQQIVNYFDEQTQLIDTSIQKEQLRIEKLKEYRQSLISDVVTGKIKVI